jgi:flagellar hook assembly protein FlgD
MGPNPFIWQLNIDFKVLYETHLNIRIFDITGKLLNTLYDSRVAAGLHHIAWNGKDNAGNDLQPGIYVVQFYTTNGSSTSFKIVRSK